jgi:hypothetical protein
MWKMQNACGRCYQQGFRRINADIHVSKHTCVVKHEKHEYNRHRKYTSPIAATLFSVALTCARPWTVCDNDIFKVSCLYVPAFSTCAVFAQNAWLEKKKLS